MHLTSWLDSVRVRLGSRNTRRHNRLQARRPQAAAAAAESLEDRTLLSVTSLWLDGELSVRSDAGDEIAIGTNSSLEVVVTVDGIEDTSVPVIAAADVRSLIVEGGDQGNVLDLRGVDASDFSFVDAITGQPISIQIDGRDGDDTIYGSVGLDDIITGGDGDDFIVGRSGNDVISGNDGDDEIHGQDGNDSLDGGNGRDLIFGGDGLDEINGGDGSDTLAGGDGHDVIQGGDHSDLVTGNAGNDTLNGESGADTLRGEDGDDSIRGGGAADLIEGGDGDDVLNGQGANDSINGNVGNDRLIGGGGQDTLNGNAGNDRLSGSGGSDLLEGGTGDDSLFGGAGADELYGDSSDPSVTGDGNDIIRGQSGNDTLYGGGGSDRLEGGQGDDLIDSFLPQLPLILISDATVENEGDVASLSVFSADFETGAPSQFSGFTSVTSVDGFAGIGTNSNVFAGDFLRNDSGCCEGLPTTPQTPTRLTLTDLPTHDSVDLDFLLAIINSWNGAGDNVTWSPDDFVVTVDGTEIFNENFRNIDGSSQGYQPPAGVALTPPPLRDLGFPGPSGVLERNDSAYNMGLDPTFDAIPHTSSTLTIEWFAQTGWEGGANESWGIDNVEVTLNGVPIQSTATFDLSLTQATSDNVSVDFATADISAVAGDDYVATTGTAHFAPGQTQQTVTVTVIGDTASESTETFALNLSNPTNAAIGNAQGIGTINDDDAASALAAASSFLASHSSEIGITPSDLDNARVTDQYVSQTSGITHVYMQQTHAGLDVRGGTIGVHMSSTGELVAVNSQFVEGLADQTVTVADLDPELAATDTLLLVADAYEWSLAAPSIDLLETPEDLPHGEAPVAQPHVLQAYSVSHEPIPMHLEWIKDGSGSVTLAWTMTVHRAEGPHVYEISADATTGEVLFETDHVHHFSYEVFAMPVANPNDGPREVVVDPQDAIASPSGWHDDGSTVYTDTRGNNATVQEDANSNDTGGNRPDGGASGDFIFPLDLTQAPSANEDAATTNAFYWANILHDVFYHYGFDEAAGNFQETNFTGQGTGGDPMIIDTLDPDGGISPTAGGPHIFVNAEGTSPRMNIGPNTLPDPDTMTSISNEIIIHEYSHGVTIRLVGGPSNVSVLSNSQGGGMGEGWADFHALMLNQKATDTPDTQEVSGDYYLQDPAGVRNYPYTSDMTANPLTYEDYNGTFPNGNAGNQIHNAGEIWASALWDVNWQMISRCGFDSDFYQGTGGNNTLMQLVIDGLKLTPESPSFLDARDAILQADANLTGGENAFDIWTGFAKRGMGFSADDGAGNNDTVTNGFDLPSGLVDPGNSHSCAAAPPGPPTPPTDPPTEQAADFLGDTLIGNAGNDTLRGALGSDLLNGGGGNDLLSGNGGDDLLYGGSARDTLGGGAGNDTLNGQGGVDTIDGEEDDDTLIWQVGASSDSFFGTEGFDELIVAGTSANNKLVVSESPVGNILVSDLTYQISAASSVTRVTINAGPGNDRITVEDVNGAAGVLLSINGENGSDTIDAAGADLGDVRMLVQGGDGHDTITGSDNDDLLRGDAGNDVINGGAGVDTIDGGANHDILSGDAGDDRITGGLDNDTINGGSGDDDLNGEDGHDNLDGGSGNDTLRGADGNDVLNGSTDDDSLLGGDGRDTLQGGTGNDFVDGGVDDDTLNGQAGDDTIAGRHGNDVIDAGSGDDVVNAGDGHDTITGGTGDDLVGGHDGNDRINTGAGNDTLVGGDGHDTLLGGGGADVAVGGDGDDFINGNGASDIVAGNEGDDRLGNNLANEIDEAFVLGGSILDLLDQI